MVIFKYLKKKNPKFHFAELQALRMQNINGQSTWRQVIRYYFVRNAFVGM